MKNLETLRLIAELKKIRAPGVFNQYAEVDPEYDVPGADAIRRENLAAYIEIFGKAKAILVGEAPSFHGCRFSGIPFMSEELLVGERRLEWAGPERFGRTSRRERPMSEHSASIVWETLGARRDVILWNAFPWHTYKPGDRTANRKPTDNELKRSAEVLRLFVGLFPKSKVVAVGRTAEHALDVIGVQAEYIRHPARGGKPGFVKGLNHLSF